MLDTTETSMAESSMKRRKSEEEEEEEEERDGGDSSIDTDRLSSLPDSLLCHIMCYLPTRTSVAIMSLLSRRWRYLWKHLRDFNFFHYSQNWESFERFEFFVNSVLALRRSRDIRKFHLSIGRGCLNYDVECVEKWILDATGPHLEELYLSIDIGRRISLPPSFFINCVNLVCLSLEGTIEGKHSSVHFPSLEFLDLSQFIVDSEELVFLSGCPKLETLIIRFDPKDISLTKLPVPPYSTSKWLKSTNHNFTWSYFEPFHTNTTLGIIGNFHSMVEAFIHVFSSCQSKFVDSILEDLDGYLLCIELCHSTSKQCPLQGPALNYPEFRKLHSLKFILPCFNLNLLVDVLEKCHMLEVLIIQSNKEEPSPLSTWEPHSIKVPRCLKSHLTYIHIEGYQGCEDELTFAEYILRNGLVLETVLIFVDTSMDLTNKYCSVKRLLDIPRGSAKCQLKFDPVVSS